MIKFNYIIFSIIVFFAFTIPEKSYSDDDVKTVVAFFSLDVNLPAYHGFLDGMNRKISETPDQSYNLILEYMDINRFPAEGEIEKTINLYNEKYKAVDIDMFITFGPGTYLLLKKFGFEAINNSPTVNIDIESNISTKSINPQFASQNALHIRIKSNYKETLKTALELFPEYQNVYIISGSSPADNYFYELTRQASEAFNESHNFIFCNGISLDSTIVTIRKIPANSIVFVTSYIEDVKKIPFSTSMVVRIISAQSKAPVFTLSDDFIHEGAIGGFVYSFIELGKQTAMITEEVLNGKPINEITIDEDSYTKHMYDWQQLKKWDLLDSQVIPKNSEFYNKDENFVIVYKWYILGGILFFVGQTLLIMFLIDLNKRQKAVARQRSENEQVYRELVREDRLSRMSELTASLSHELNQPLTAILYTAQAGKRFLETGKLDKKQGTEIFENIIEDDKRAGSLISSVRSLMKLEDREKEKVNLNSLIQETEKLFYSESIAQHIHINLKLQERAVHVFGDKIQLQQVLLNLLFNAANSMDNNSLENKKIDIIQLLDNGNVTVSIRDSGSGFEESIKANLFKPFVTSRAKGLGIGLAVSRSIIESHHGVIWAVNLPAGGAEFSFKLEVLNGEK